MIIKFGDYILKPADVLVVKDKTFDLFDHYAVYLGNGKFIAFMRKGIVEINLTDFNNFTGNFYPVRLKKFPGTEWERKLAMGRAQNCVLPAYSLLFANCEHFAEYVQTGKRRSLQSARAGLLLLGGGALISSNSKTEGSQIFGAISMLAGIFALLNEASGDNDSINFATI